MKVMLGSGKDDFVLLGPRVFCRRLKKESGVKMENDYPTDEQLGLIREYDLSNEVTPRSGPTPLIKMLREIWHWPDYFRYADGFLELHTGGWSGNEDIIEALQGTMFWTLYWLKSERGGHYYFWIPELKGFPLGP